MIWFPGFEAKVGGQRPLSRGVKRACMRPPRCAAPCDLLERKTSSTWSKANGNKERNTKQSRFSCMIVTDTKPGVVRVDEKLEMNPHIKRICMCACEYKCVSVQQNTAKTFRGLMFPERRYFWHEATRICLAVCWCWPSSPGHGWGLRQGMYTTSIRGKTDKGCKTNTTVLG